MQFQTSAATVMPGRRLNAIGRTAPLVYAEAPQRWPFAQNSRILSIRHPLSQDRRRLQPTRLASRRSGGKRRAQSLAFAGLNFKLACASSHKSLSRRKISSSLLLLTPSLANALALKFSTVRGWMERSG